MKTYFLPTLYSRTSTGAIQQWSVVVEGNSYKMISGQQGGKLVESAPTICVGKNIGRANETTPEEQAWSEADSNWTKKKKTGYTDDISKIDSCLSYVEPMLAKSFDDYIDKTDFKMGVLIQNKYNGVRCIARLEGSEVVLKSRKGEPWLSVPHINADLRGFFVDHPNAVLDGELFNEDLKERLNDLIHIVRKTKAKELTPKLFNESEKVVRFYIYDGYSMTDGLGPEVAYEIRKEWIDENLPKYSKYYRKVETERVFSMEDVDAIYGRYLDRGEEGAIIRIMGTPYQNTRSKFLLKYKPEMDSEAVILDVEPGVGNYSHRAKTSSIKWNDKVFKATWMGKENVGVNILKNKADWIGKTITFKYTHLTGLGVPQYARIDPLNCLRAD